VLAGSIDCPHMAVNPERRRQSSWKYRLEPRRTFSDTLRYFGCFSGYFLSALPRHSGKSQCLKTVLLFVFLPVSTDFLDSGLRRNHGEVSTGEVIWAPGLCREIKKKQPPEFWRLLWIPEVLGLQVAEFGI